MPLSLEERVSFIQGINVRPSAGVTVAADTTAGASDAAVSAGSSVAFVSNIDSQMKADVLNSTLMAQLNASELHNRETDPRSWYNTYLETLMAIGWEVKEFDFTLIQDTDNFLTSDELFLDYVSKYMPTAEFALFRRMLTALQQPQNSKASKLLDDEARTLRMSNWQAGVVSNDGGNPTFKINAFLCSASWTLEHAMFFKLRQGGGEVEITAGLESAVAAADGGNSEAAVSAGSSVAFVAGLDHQMKADVLDSTLMAQLNADFLHDRETEPRAWYNTYLQTLIVIGWEVKEFNLVVIEDTNNFLTGEELFLDYVSNQAHASAGLQNSSASKLLDDQARSLKMSNSQAGVVSNDGGNPTFKINASLCSASWVLEHAMFFKLRQGSGDIEISAEHQVMHLDLAKYSEVRDAVLERLGDSAQLLISDIAL
ncbi:hypothetical protein ONZ51_g8887 [Trametes cubensis]|uniref:Uncharacterized protein n=1 Tax=Trametes cubensis TaxID=1111947 RepID=A0AAD7TNJ9_9APHY|nr:hypothetical protein ONZ51_g8887 [Trametes cubensis]